MQPTISAVLDSCKGMTIHVDSKQAYYSLATALKT